MIVAKSGFFLSEILTLFVNTLSTDYKYSRRNMMNFTQQLEALLLQKQKTFSGLFLAFLKCALNLEHFGEKYEYSSLLNSKVIDSKRGGYLNVQKVLPRNTIR